MRDDDILVVRELSLFSSMSDKHFDDLFKMAYLQRFPAHVQLVSEGDPTDFLHVLVEGTVELFGKSNVQETTLFVLRPVSVYHLSAVLDNSVYLLSARTLDTSRILMIPAINVQKVMSEDTAFAYAMVKELAKRYQTVIRAFKEERLRTGLERLANYLLRANAQASSSGQIELTEDKRKLAALLGMTPEYLSRAFNTLKKYGVEVKGSKIYLKNLDALTHVAKPNPLIDRRKV